MSKPVLQYVGLKLFCRKGDCLLVLREEGKDYVDLPGGRINEGEESTPFEEILAREVREELGGDFRFKLGSKRFFWRLYRPESNFRVLMIGFEAEYLGGEITISEEHSAFEWMPISKIDSLNSGNGFDDGLREYRQWFIRRI